VVEQMGPSVPERKLACPVWARDDSAFAVVESSDTGSRLYVVPWTGVPAAPVLALESAQRLAPYALMYR